jgi:putative ABC transport system permease protein
VISVALRGLAGRKLRSALTALAIVLGVAMVSGTYVLTDTIDKAFDSIFQESYAGTDAAVTGRAADISFGGESPTGPPIPADLLERIRSLPDAEAATGSVIDQTSTKILTKEGKAVSTNGAPSFGFGIDPAETRFNPLRLREGRWATADNEVVIDVATAEKEGYSIGDTIKIATLEPVRSFQLVGLAQYGDVESLGTATFAVFTIPTAQELLDREGKFDAISVAAKPGVTPDELVREIRPILPDSAQVRSGVEQADEDSQQADFTKIIRYVLLAFAGIALFVGAFVIFNTLSITVAQRTREFATLRTIGASRRQLLTSVVLEALVVGIVASVVGLFLGLGLAVGLDSLFEAVGADLPTTGLVFAPRTVVVSLAVGIVVTVLAGLFPALRATRVPPIAAVREGATLPRSRIAPFAPYIALVAVAVAIALLAYATLRDDLATVNRLVSIGVGVVLLFLGVALVSSRVVRPLAVATGPVGKWGIVVASLLVYPFTIAYWWLRAAVFSHDAPLPGRLIAAVIGVVVALGYAVVVGLLAGAALAWLGSLLTGLGVVVVVVLVLAVLAMWVRRRLTRFEPEWPAEFPDARPDRSATEVGNENARRNPGRTAATAAALMIGVALVTFVSVLANGMKASNRGAIEDQVKADYVVTSQDGFTPFVAGAGDAIAQAEGTEVVTNVRAELGKVGDSANYVTGIEPETIAEVYNFEWAKGSDEVLARLGENGAIVDEDFAEENGLRVGQTIELLTSSNTRAKLEIKALYKPPPFFPLLGALSIPQETFDELYERPRNSFTFVNVPGEPSGAHEQALEAAVEDFPDAKVHTRDGWIDEQDAQFNRFLLMLYVLLALSVIVSIFGMVNTLVLSVYERTRELGMLRAVGMTRRQVRRMVRHESVITALIGAAIGVPLGIFLAALVTRALAEFDLKFSIPVDWLVVFAIVAIVVGIAAAIMPARRAARLNVLQALQYE